MSDDVLNIDLDHLTVGEVEQIEELTGQAFDTLAEPGKPKGKMLRALAFVIRRRTDADFTWEAAGNLKVVLNDETVPTTAASE